ncbi:uncharacterized protein LOC124262818 [Haliotis rubra]|uniref:uncharacterized protein LOC124262818 n=1 Tax=Haliotis rubra TaxID=36100 RepID=UPI001EE5DD33|nr:uncharacterized protein LOC124262818 [Haliotis rubra]
MWLLILFTLSIVAYAQFGLGVFDFGTGKISGYTFEYHRSADLVLVRNATACFIVETDEDLTEKMKNRGSREGLENVLYGQIQAELGETVASLTDLRSDYHDIRAVAECFNHDVFKIQYSSS